MSGNGAEMDEMAFLTRPTPEDADLAAFAHSLRASLVTVRPAGQAAAIVPRLAEEARIAHAQPPAEERGSASRFGPRIKTVGQLALGFCLVPLAAAGLATAGVHLPEPAQRAFESVGIELPNQDDGATEAPAPPATTPSGVEPGSAPASKPAAPRSESKKGKGKGKGKANARGKAQSPGQSGPPGSNGNGNGGSGSPGNSGSAPGRGKTGGSPSSGANGNAVGKTGATPPGQTGKPASPGKSGSAPGKTK